MSGWWYQGIEAQAPKVQVILECLVSDFASNELSFEDFVYEFGYEIKDVASYREVEKTYKQVMRQNKSLLRVFGADLLRSMSEAI